MFGIDARENAIRDVSNEIMESDGSRERLPIEELNSENEIK